VRILFFGSGSPASVIALDAVARAATIAGVVAPQSRFAMPLIAAAKRRGVKIHDIDRIEAEADLICIATFPSIIKPQLLQLAARGAINAHMSLLPKHRGPDPLFWTYLQDDRWTGVTVHWMDEKADAGPILLQREMPLGRGRSVINVYNDLAIIGGDLLASAVRLIEAGTAPRITQDESAATHEPSRSMGEWRIDAATWPAERVWHVMRGLTVGQAAMLRDANGRPLHHGQPRGYSSVRVLRPAGTVERTSNGWRVHCIDGYVDIEPEPRATLVQRLVRQLRPWR